MYGSTDTGAMSLIAAVIAGEEAWALASTLMKVCYKKEQSISNKDHKKGQRSMHTDGLGSRATDGVTDSGGQQKYMAP